jgi:DHA2 family multidrug resistance protein-like MFS transporter
MVMQLSMSIGVTIAGMLLGLYGQQHISAEPRSPSGLSLYLSEHGGDYRAAGAHFSRVPDDTTSNTVIRRRKRSES